MIRIISSILLLFILFFFLITLYKGNNTWSPSKETFVPSPVKQKTNNWKTIMFEDKLYAFLTIKPSHVTSITLIPNFNTQKSSQSLMGEHSCIYGVNAGFYDKEYKPLGLFVTDKKEYSSRIESALLNGFFTIDDRNRAAIQSYFTGNNRIALQSGPLLMLEGKPLPLKIKNDEFARRSIAAVSRNGDVLFLSIFLPESEISGPLLQNLPNVLMEINRGQKFNITDALNLDGGSASFFKGVEAYLEEITTVGGAFCIK